MAITPFTLSPNPAWMYMTENTARNIEEIKWVIEDKQGLACIFGDIGIGKSSLLRYILNEYDSDESKYRLAYLTRVDCTSAFALTKQICSQFNLPSQRSLLAQNNVLEEFLLKEDEAGRTVIAFMDEGQQLSYELLEVIRNLLNFETLDHKLIQVVVAGQMELRDRILLKRARAFASRIFSPVVVQPLSANETREMIHFRCNRIRFKCPFTDNAIELIHSRSRGVPRSILITCARALKEFPNTPIDHGMIGAVISRAEAALQQGAPTP